MTKIMISARIPDELDEKLAALAEMTKRSKAYLLTEALEDYVERKAWLTKNIQDAVKAADESGEFISHEAMERWVDSLGTTHELSPPEPNIFKKHR